jgi:hypothetical protein
MARPLTEEIFTETTMPRRPDIQRILTSRDSVPIDKYSIYGNLRETTRIHKYFRLAYKLGIRGMTTHMARFAVDFDKFRTRRNARNYNISGRPFSSATTSFSVQDMRRVAKVKTFLMRHLTREPTDKDVDLVVYTYFGSDAFADIFTDLHNGLQDSYYNARGRRIHTGFRVQGLGAQRRRQSRIQSYGNMYNNSTYRYHSYNNNSSNNNGLGSNSYNNGLGSNSNNSNNRPTDVEYLQNKPAVKRNQNRNKSNNAKKIQWTENTVSNMPRDRISFENFSNGQKAVKYTWREGGGNFSQYIEPNTFRTQARMSMTDAYNKPGSFSMFKNPFTRNGRDVKRSNINFVILKKRVNKRKTNAATKIQKVVRGTQVRNKIRKNAQNALNKLAVVQKSVLKKKTEKQATAKRKRNAEDEAKRKRGRSITRRMKNAVVNTARRVKRKITR